MELIDTHTHLYLPEFSGDVAAVIARATDAGVSRFFLPDIDPAITGSMEQLENRYPGRCFAMAGLHPCSVKEQYRQDLDTVASRLAQRPYAAIGETGLDFYWDRSFVKEQVDSLRTQAAWALERDIPLVLHTREAMQETIDIIRPFAEKGLRGIFHCFSGTPAQAAAIIRLNFYLGIGGVITYKNSGVAAVVAGTGLEHLVLETDAPYLSPVPFRGKRNESGYLTYIAAKIADVKNVLVEEVAEVTTRNARSIFSKILPRHI